MPDNVSQLGPSINGGDVDAMRIHLDALTSSQMRYNLALEGSDRFGRQFGRTLTNAFVGLAVHGKGLSDVLSGLALSISKIALNAAFKPLETAFGTALQSLVSSSSIVSGNAPAASTSFSQSGSIFSNGGFSSLIASSQGAASPVANVAANGANIVFNVTTSDAASFQQSQTQIAAVLARALAQGQRNL